MRIRDNWPRFVFICVPLLIVAIDAVVLVGERLEPEPRKAVRLVKESNSQKENLTVQQYLYTTLYHRKSNGEAISIAGWRANASSESGGPMIVEFSYTDPTGEHVAAWEVNVKDRTVVPKNDAALELSWH